MAELDEQYFLFYHLLVSPPAFMQTVKAAVQHKLGLVLTQLSRTTFKCGGD